MKTEEIRKSRIQLILSMIIFGTIGIFRRWIPVSSSFLALARGLIGAAFLAIWMKIRHQKADWKGIRKNLIRLAGSGILIGLNWMFLFESYQYVSVAKATLCYYMAPVFVILASPILLKEKLSRRKIFCCIFACAGMVLVSGVNSAGMSDPDESRGILLVLLAAVLYASVILMNQKIRDLSADDRTVIQLLAAALVMIPYVLIQKDMAGTVWSLPLILLILTVGIVHTGIAYAMYFGSMEYLPAQTVALISYLDPVTAMFLSAWILKEPMTVMQIIGAVLILGSAAAAERVPKNRNPE